MSDTYTGKVTVGGEHGRAAAARPDHRQAGGRADVNNAYLLRCTQTDEGLLIDAANEADRLRELVRVRGAAGVGDPDHAPARATTGRRWRRSPTTPAPRSTPATDDADELPVAVDERLQHGDTITVGDADARDHRACAATRPARSPCSTATRRASPHLFTGDSLFPGGVGKTGSPEDFTSLIDDVDDARLRRAARRHLVLPRPRRRLDARRRAPAPRRVARARLVTALGSQAWANPW